MTDKDIVNILLSQLDLKKVIRENPEISMDEVDGIVKKIKSFFDVNDKKIIYVYTDGASRGNPGDSGIGVVIKDEKMNTIEEYCEYVGNYTNNVAEYKALICGLKIAEEFNPSGLKIFSDSQLMVMQVKGEWRVKDLKLIALYEETMSILKNFNSWEINAISRKENKRADALANMGIDKRENKDRSMIW